MWRVYPELYHSRVQTDIVIVEGFKACMWVYQAGFHNVVALLGHSLTDNQKTILEHVLQPVYLFLDNDPRAWDGCEDAGRKLARSMPVRVMLYPDRIRDDPCAQPDSCTLDEIRFQKENAVDFWDFRHFRRQTAS
jgi:DNA primase